MSEKGKEAGIAVTAEELARINRFAKKELRAEEVYTFAVKLCDNEVDRDFERFDRAALEELSELFVGRTGIFDHSWSAGGQTARIYRAAVVKAVKVSAATPTGYEAAFAALEQEAVDVIVCDSTSVDVQLKLRASVEKASGAQKERIGVVSGGASETAAKLVERAGKLNSERMVLTAPGDVRMAAAAAAVIAGESDPSVPVNGAVLAGFSGLSASYDDTQVDTLVTGGVTPLECVSGEVSIVRGITTRTTTGGAADKTWRELTTVRIVDDVIPALRASLRARFVRSKNTAQVRAAIRSQVMVELENKRAQEIIDSFGEVSVKASEDDPTVCLVEFSFAVAHGLNRIYLSAHITV